MPEGKYSVQLENETEMRWEKKGNSEAFQFSDKQQFSFVHSDVYFMKHSFDLLLSCPTFYINTRPEREKIERDVTVRHSCVQHMGDWTCI